MVAPEMANSMHSLQCKSFAKTERESDAFPCLCVCVREEAVTLIGFGRDGGGVVVRWEGVVVVGVTKAEIEGGSGHCGVSVDACVYMSV